MKGLERAEGDLARGDVRQARDRLRGLLNTYPHDLDVRRLLAEAHRRDGQLPEAGRWGYLVGPDASDQERDAFERHSAFGWSGRISEARLRALLRCDDLVVIADGSGRDLLRSLPDKRHPQRQDGLVGAALRRIAARRARATYR
ncbi:DUF6584 family protein [Cellulomonas sp. URHB0016]